LLERIGKERKEERSPTEPSFPFLSICIGRNIDKGESQGRAIGKKDRKEGKKRKKIGECYL